MTKNWIICAAAALLAASSAFAQRATTEERAADYIRGAFLTQAAPGILDDHVTVAPELAKRLKLASGAGSSKVYEALAAMTDNKPALSPQGAAQLDGEILPKIAAAEIRHINVAGHTDTIGREKYNQKLSEKRAEAVRAYLVAKGVDASKIEAAGFGKTQPVKECKEKRRAAQIECLAPNRRVVVEIEALAKN